MSIILVRVDDRLIHGQILQAWLPSIKANELLVPSDTLAADETQRAIFESAIPRSTRLVIDTVERIAEILLQGHDRRVRRMVIVEHLRDALRLKRAGVPFQRLNLGNIRSAEGTLSLSRTVFVGQECLRSLREIVRAGVNVDLQTVPFEKRVDLFDAFRPLDPSVYRDIFPAEALRP